MTQVVAEDRTVKDARATNRQALTKIVTLGPQLFKVRKSSFLVKANEITHEIVALEKYFFWVVSLRS